MKKTSIIVHQSYLEQTIKRIHEMGMMEIFNISKNEPDLLEETEKSLIHADTDTTTTYEQRLTRLIDILQKISPKKSGIKAILKPDLLEIKKIEDLVIDDLYSYAEGTLNEIEKQIIQKEEQLQKINEKIDFIKDDLTKLEYLKDFNFNISDIGESEYLILKAGLTTDIETLKNNISKIDNAEIYISQFGSGKKIKWSALIVSYISEKERIEKIIRENLNEFNFNNIDSTPKQAIEFLKNNLKNIKKEKKEITKELREIAKDQISDLLSLREQVQIEKARMEISRNFVKTDHTYIIKGWILEKNTDEFEKEISSITNDYVICNFENPSINPDNPPIYFKTPKWADGFKGLLEMFALPRYNEVNPTIIMGIFFILFFGIMLGDAGYGLVILSLSIFGYIKFGKHSDMIRSWSFMGLWMGIVTTVVGLLTSSFFGDFIPRFIYGDPSAPLYTLEISGITLPANSIKDPITILIIALFFGLIHLNIGVILGIIQAGKSKKYKEMLTSKSCWIPLQIGGGILVGFAILDFQFPSIILIIAAALVVIGLLQLFISAGPIGFFDITGYVGDWLSYARLLALGLATTGMALAFNVVAQLLGEMIPLIGIIIMIILLIIAHLVNLGLQSLGAGIHSLRLQYVEFFNRFYEGGGQEFSPFKINRKYTKIEDEKIE